MVVKKYVIQFIDADSDEVRLQKYRDSLISAWGYNDYNDWPIKYNTIMHLFLEEFAEEFISDLSDLQAQNIDKRCIAEAFYNPARLYRIIHSVIFGLRMKKIPIESQRKIALYMLDLVKLLKEGSEFNEDGTNIILSEQQVKDIEMKEVKDPVEGRLVQGLCGVIWAYTEAIFFRAHDVTKEIHGIYKLPDGNQVLVREYLNLNFRTFWDQFPLIDYKSIRIYAKYNQNIQVSIDAYNHLFLRAGNYVQDLIAYRIEVDGKSSEINDVMQLTGDFQKTIEGIYDWSRRADWHEIANKYADIYWFRKSPLPIMLGKEWMVPNLIRRKISQGAIDERRLNTLSGENIARLISLVV